MNPKLERTIDQEFQLQRVCDEIKKEQESGGNDVRVQNFADLYGQEVITKDAERVAELEARYLQEVEEDPSRKEVSMLAKVAEFLIEHNIEMEDWMGPEAMTLPVCAYDDYVNGVDMTIEFGDENDVASHLVLGIDITIAHELSKKLNRIKREIDAGKLATVKYFQSEKLNFRGEMKNVPRVVIAIEGSTIRELISLWTQPEGSKKALANHFVQYQILEEVEMQLERFLVYARGHQNNNLIPKFERALKKVKQIRAEKNGETARVRDQGFSDLRNQIERVFV